MRKGPISNEAERIRQRQRLDALEAEATEIKIFAEKENQKLWQQPMQNWLIFKQKCRLARKSLQTTRQLRDKAKQDADEAQLALKSATVRSDDVSQALELATADKHSILSDEGFEPDLEKFADAS